MSEASVTSTQYLLKTGDIVRIGTDFKASPGGKEDEVRDIRHRCILVRILLRPKAVAERPTGSKNRLTQLDTTSSKVRGNSKTEVSA